MNNLHSGLNNLLLFLCEQGEPIAQASMSLDFKDDFNP